jgi:eukaryotic-like serine/threonine-protein kinase
MDRHSRTCSHPATLLALRDPRRYRIISEHGRGGVGRVMRARDRDLGREVALKEPLHRTPGAEARFLREAIITARLEHPNIVPVHDVGRWPDGTPYYAMKLVSGRPLKQLIDEAVDPSARLALIARVVAVADAIAYAHGRGVIHRDLKPSNVIVGDHGETVVIDWGLARHVVDPDVEEAAAGGGAARVAAHLTRTGAVLGTPAYMAPEQALGGDVSERADVYALGAILRDVLAGHSAAQAVSGSPSPCPDAATLAGWIDRVPGEIDGRMPLPLQSIVCRAMSVSPWDRYDSARDLGDDLRRFLAGERVTAHRYGRRERAGRWLGSHRTLLQAAAVVILALLTAIAWCAARHPASTPRVTAYRARCTGR